MPAEEYMPDILFNISGGEIIGVGEEGTGMYIPAVGKKDNYNRRYNKRRARQSVLRQEKWK